MTDEKHDIAADRAVRMRAPLVDPALGKTTRTITLWGMALNLALSGVKFLAGWLGASQALIADAVHSLADTSTDLAVLIGVYFWAAPADAGHPHGHRRIETLVSFFIAVMLAAVGVGLAYNAVVTLPAYHDSTPGWIAFVAACVSIVVKECLFRWTVRTGRRLKSSALIANAWHHRSDAMSSIPVAVAVLATKIFPSVGYLDHVAAILVSALIIRAAWRIAWPALTELVDAGAAAKDAAAILDIAAGIQDVRAVHALRTRRVAGGLQVDLHVLVDPAMSVAEGHRIAGRVKERLISDGPDVVDVLIHIEPYGVGRDMQNE